jgi:hypothetical protein
VQPYSPDIPWVSVGSGSGGIFVATCEVCGLRSSGQAQAVDAFALAHAEHVAPEGSWRLGDAVARLAKPVAKALGRPTCTPCAQRQYALNALGARGLR